VRIGNFETSQRTGPAALKKNDGRKAQAVSTGVQGFTASDEDRFLLESMDMDTLHILWG